MHRGEPFRLHLGPMDRQTFHLQFRSPGPVVLPVIHVVDTAQVRRNISLAIRAGAPGVFLINHDFGVEPFLPIIRDARAAFPSYWIGVNFLAVTGERAFPVLGDLQRAGCRIDAYWADDARINEAAAASQQDEASRISRARQQSGWQGLYLGGTCFKKQREVDPANYADAARLATGFMDAVCTSGVATGHSADLAKIQTFRRSVGDHVLALASGITPDNASSYADVDCFMVATGISAPGDFYNLDIERLHALLTITRALGANDE